jgi:hypothetical protein
MCQAERQTITYLRGAHLQLTYVICCHLPTSFPVPYLRLLCAPPPTTHKHRYGAQCISTGTDRHRQISQPKKIAFTHMLCWHGGLDTHAVLRTLTHMCCVHLHTCAACMHGEYTCILLQTDACSCKEALALRQLTANTGGAQTASTANTHQTASKEKQSYRHSVDCHSTPPPHKRNKKTQKKTHTGIGTRRDVAGGMYDGKGPDAQDLTRVDNL